MYLLLRLVCDYHVQSKDKKCQSEVDEQCN